MERLGSGTLHIREVRIEDAGAYTCRTYNAEDSIDTDATLTVQGEQWLRLLMALLLSLSPSLAVSPSPSSSPTPSPFYYLLSCSSAYPCCRVISDGLFLYKFVFDVCVFYLIFVSRLTLWILKNFSFMTIV